ncbi:NEDD4-binding protein 1-like [Hemitrygon akajei]|uniref:NEDD4-binding protein 1-like n=1 Tax=Hemitrygon akajei TaxID=2704970 RepID=UPI003BF9F0D5
MATSNYTERLIMAGVATSSRHVAQNQPYRVGPSGTSDVIPRRCQAQDIGQVGAQVSDEFAVSRDKQIYLENNKDAIQELFQVVLTILAPTLMARYIPESVDSQQIWAQLKGTQEHVRKAKEYIKGICNPELHQIECYPKDMHCIFAGARGLFLKSLIQDTCADISMKSAGVIAIYGCAEAVIMAKTRIQQFVKLFRDNQCLPPRRESSIKRKFKLFVELHADKYTMDLLLLPSSVQEELLNLTQEVLHLKTCIDLTLDTDHSQPVVHDGVDSSLETQRPEEKCNDLPSFEEIRKQAGTPVSELAHQMDTVLTQDTQQSGRETEISREETSVVKERQSCKRRSSASEDRHTKRQFSGDIEEFTAINATAKSPCIDLVTDSDDVLIHPLSGQQDNQIEEDSITATSEKEFRMLMEFFTSMGYSIDIVKKVIKEMGETEEPMELLKKIVEESNRLEKEQASETDQTSVPNNTRERLMNEARNSYMKKLEDCTIGTAEEKLRKQISASSTSSFPQRSELLKENFHSEDVALIGNAQNNKDKVLKLPALRPTKGAESFCSAKLWTSDLTNERMINENDIVARGSSEQTNLPVNCVVPSNQPVRASVTGAQRFHDLLKGPYKLNLTNAPGKQNLKHIVIDGSNVAMSHGMKKVFSCRGIAIAVEYFWNRGHRKITAFVPQWRTKRDPRITEQHFLNELEELGVLSFTPARSVCGTRIASHDDRFLLHLAEKTGGIIVTNDNLKEFVHESAAWKSIIQERLLQYTFVGDIFMIPDDPLGRNGPRLDIFLQAETSRTFPNAVVNQSVPIATPPVNYPPLLEQPVIPHLRSKEETEQLKQELFKIFPDFTQREKIDRILSANPLMRDPNALSALVLDHE